MQTLNIEQIEQVDGGVLPLAAAIIGYGGGTMGVVALFLDFF